MMGLHHVGPERALPFLHPSLHCPALYPHPGQKRPAPTPRLAGGRLDCPFQWWLTLGLKKLTSLESILQYVSRPAPVSASAFVNSTSAGIVPALVPRKPGQGHTPEKPPAESKPSHYLITVERTEGPRAEAISAVLGCAHPCNHAPEHLPSSPPALRESKTTRNSVGEGT